MKQMEKTITKFLNCRFNEQANTVDYCIKMLSELEKVLDKYLDLPFNKDKCCGEIVEDIVSELKSITLYDRDTHDTILAIIKANILYPTDEDIVIRDEDGNFINVGDYERDAFIKGMLSR